MGTLIGLLGLNEKKAVVTREVIKLAQKICGMIDIHIVS
jgi:hypothetical protein